MSTEQKPVATTTSGTSQPWEYAVGPLRTALGGAEALYNAGGSKAYTGPTQAAMSDPSQQALNQTLATANGQGGLLGGQAVNYASGVMGDGGISSQQQGALGVLGNAANGGMQIGTGGFQNYLGQAGAPTASGQNLQGMAGGMPMSSAETNLQSMANGSDLSHPNPYLQAALEAANRQTADQVNGQFSAAGRYGSGAQTNVLSRNIGENNTNAYMQDYENARNRMMSANSQIDQARNANSGLQLQANGQIDQAAQGRLSSQLAGLNGLAGIQGQNIQNQLSSASGLSDAYAGGMNRALSTALNGQQFTNQLYDPAQKIAGVGSFYDDRAQNELNANISQYQNAQQLPWQNLAQLNAIATGAGQLGGTTSQVQVKPGQSQLQQYLGYGTAGLGLLGKL